MKKRTYYEKAHEPLLYHPQINCENAVSIEVDPSSLPTLSNFIEVALGRTADATLSRFIESNATPVLDAGQTLPQGLTVEYMDGLRTIAFRGSPVDISCHLSRGFVQGLIDQAESAANASENKATSPGDKDKQGDAAASEE